MPQQTPSSSARSEHSPLLRRSGVTWVFPPLSEKVIHSLSRLSREEITIHSLLKEDAQCNEEEE